MKSVSEFIDTVEGIKLYLLLVLAIIGFGPFLIIPLMGFTFMFVLANICEIIEDIEPWTCYEEPDYWR